MTARQHHQTCFFAMSHGPNFVDTFPPSFVFFSWKIISWRIKKNTLSTRLATTQLNKESTTMLWLGGCWTSPLVRATCLKNSLSPWFGIGFVVTSNRILSLPRRSVEGDSTASHSITNCEGACMCIGCTLSPTQYIRFDCIKLEWFYHVFPLGKKRWINSKHLLAAYF